jgi:hypothetical protein
MPLSADLISGGLAVVGAVVWLIRLEGRVNTTERDLASANAKAEAE